MKQLEYSESRAGMSRTLAALAVMCDMDRALFRRKFAEFRREVVRECFYTSTPKITFRHLILRNGRQRFVLFVEGRQHDYFEFETAGCHAEAEALRGRLEKMTFNPQHNS